MQNLEKYYGIKAEIREHLEPEDLHLLAQATSRYAFLEKITLKSYLVYFHFLTITAEEVHFGLSGGVASRVKEFALSFNVNQKQQEREGGKSPKIIFLNYVLRETDKTIFEFLGRATPDELIYFIPASYFDAERTFQNLIVTLVNKRVRNDHRKIKVTLSVRPTEAFGSRLAAENSVRVTALDARLKKSVTISIQSPNTDRPDEPIPPFRLEDTTALCEEFKLLDVCFKKDMFEPSQSALVQAALDFIEGGAASKATRCLAPIYNKVKEVAEAKKLLMILDFLERGEIKYQKFQVALTFSGEQRDYVEAVAVELMHLLGKEEVFYDRTFKAHLARPNLDLLLHRIYLSGSDLVVVFISLGYAGSDWCGLEWRAVREIIKKRDDKSIMLIRFDDTSLAGLYTMDGYLDAKAHSPEETAQMITHRLPVTQ